MAKARKPMHAKSAQKANYGKLLAGHDMPLGIAAVKAATSGKKHEPERRKSWAKKPTGKD